MSATHANNQKPQARSVTKNITAAEEMEEGFAPFVALYRNAGKYVG